jgi:uncharacterized coiled-coil DUF342 family protein
VTDAKDSRIAEMKGLLYESVGNIARLEARIAELEAERDTAFDEWTRTMEVNRGLVAERDGLQDHLDGCRKDKKNLLAERDRLRTALTQIANYSSSRHSREIARTALAGDVNP